MISAARHTDVELEGDAWVAFCTLSGCDWSASGFVIEAVARCVADCHEDQHHTGRAAGEGRAVA
jgi:hypothetical protein